MKATRLLLWTMLLVMASCMVNAFGLDIQLNSPANATTYDGNNSIALQFTVTGDSMISYPTNNATAQYTCMLNQSTTDAVSGFSEYTTIYNVNNATLKTTTVTEQTNGTYYWQVDCWNENNDSEYNASAYSYNYEIAITQPIITLNGPTNASYDDDGSVTFNWTVSGEGASTFTCTLWTDENGTSMARNTESSISNNTATTVLRNSISDRELDWYVVCVDVDNNPINATSGTQTIFVDSTAPVITVRDGSGNGTVPADGGWLTSDLANLSFLIVDEYPSTCWLRTEANVSSNDTGTLENKAGDTYTNATVFSPTTMSGVNAYADTQYSWRLYCNDSAGSITSTALRTFAIDTVDPSVFIWDATLFKTNFNTLWNYTTATDKTPQVGWNQTTETNFSRYRVRFYNTSLGAFTEVNVTSISQLSANITTLGDDLDYLIYITAFDEAGNSVDMTNNGYWYSTDATCSELTAGWNLCMHYGNPKTLDALFNETGATTVSVYNGTHQFESFTGSGATYYDTEVNFGDTLFIYVATDELWSDNIWNETTFTYEVNLTNATSETYNVACNRNETTSFTFQELDFGINGNKTFIHSLNVTYMSLYNNSASVNYKYVPFVGNWTYNNATVMQPGECAWFNMNPVNGINIAGNVSYYTLNWRDIK